MKNHGFKSVFEVCAALLAQYIAFYMISSRLGKEAEIENFLTNKFVMIFWVIYLTNKFIRSSKTMQYSFFCFCSYSYFVYIPTKDLHSKNTMIISA